MRVPTYQRQVPIETARVQAPRKPAISKPRVVPGAFGEDIGRAVENLGKVGTKIAGHLQQMAFDEQDREVLHRETEYRKNLQNRLTDQEEETIQVNGQDVTRPKGFLQRQLSQAKGATEELDKVYQEEIAKEYLKGLSRYQLNKLGPSMNNYYLSVRNNVITHEANQLDEDLKLVTKSNLEQKVLDASIIRDDKQLSLAIDDAIQSASTYNRKYDEATRKILESEIARDISTSAIIATVERTGDYSMAKMMLDGIKDKIPDSVYNTINDEMAKRAVGIAISEDMSVHQENSPVMTELQKKKGGKFYYLSTTDRIKAIKESQQKIFYNSQIKKRGIEEEQNVRHNDILDKMLAGTFTLADVANELLIPEEQGGLKKKMLLNYQKRLQNDIARDLNAMLTEKDSDKDPTVRSKKVRQYNDLISLFIDDETDKWVAREKLSEAYRDGIIDVNELNFLDDLKTNLKDIGFNRSTGKINSAIKSLKNWLNDNNASDEEIAIRLKQLLGTAEITPDAVKAVELEHLKSKIPETMTIPEKGQLFMDGFGNLVTVYPDGTIEPYIKQPKTKSENKKPQEKK
jgi:hypothetical protein